MHIVLQSINQSITFVRAPVTGDHWCHTSNLIKSIDKSILIGSDRRPETKQGIEGKIVTFRSGRVRDRLRIRDKDR